MCWFAFFSPNTHFLVTFKCWNSSSFWPCLFLYLQLQVISLFPIAFNSIFMLTSLISVAPSEHFLLVMESCIPHPAACLAFICAGLSYKHLKLSTCEKRNIDFSPTSTLFFLHVLPQHHLPLHRKYFYPLTFTQDIICLCQKHILSLSWLAHFHCSWCVSYC